jgi:hypothetical protein
MVHEKRVMGCVKRRYVWCVAYTKDDMLSIYKASCAREEGWAKEACFLCERRG